MIWRPDKTTSLYYKVRDRDTHGRSKRETETQVKDLLASGVPPKGLEARVNFGGNKGSMLVRREWFDAVSKGMV